MKRVQANVEKYSMMIATNLTSICCVLNDLKRRTQRPYKFGKLQYLTRIVKNQLNSKHIIQILQPIIIDFFRRIRIQLILKIFFICFMYNALKTPTSRPAGVSALYALKDSTWERLLAGKKRRLYIKQIKISWKYRQK